ncbi:MAG: alpha/beta hydrolase [Pseudomonadota bacterium]
MKRLCAAFLVLIAILFLLWPESKFSPPALPSEGAHTFTLSDESEFTGTFGTLTVPENRHTPESRDISVAYFVMEGEKKENKAPPTFVLAGGPGGSFFRQLFRDGPVGEGVEFMRGLYAEHSDLILYELRGINYSQPVMRCEDDAFFWSPIRSVEDARSLLRANARRCRQKLIAEGFDLAGYTVLEAAQDIVDIADHLGIETFGLQGTSFGSHLAMALMKYHPDRVDRALLSGVEGYDHTYDGPKALRETLMSISKQAASVWQASGRKDDPLTAFEAFAAGDVSSFEPYELSFLLADGQDFNLGSRYSMRDWPAHIARILDGDMSFETFALRNFAPMIFPLEGSGVAAVGLFDCSSGLSDERRSAMQDYGFPIFQQISFFIYDSTCPAWNVPTLPDSFRDNSPVDVPVLFVQGDIDFSTPIHNTIDLLHVFRQAQLITVKNGSHGALGAAFAEQEEKITLLINQWFRGGDVNNAVIELPPVVFSAVPEKKY